MAPGRLHQDDERAVLAAALAVTALVARGAGHEAIAGAAARHLQRLLTCQVAAVFLDAGLGRLDLVAAYGPRAVAARTHWRGGVAVRGRRPHPAALVTLPNDPDCALVPLRARGRLVGALAVASNRLDDRDRSLARAFAARIAPPLEHGVLAAELATAAQATERSADLDGALRAILAGVRCVVPADAAGVLIREGDRARVIAVDGHPDEALGHLLPIAGDISLEGPLLRGEPVRLNDLGAIDGDPDTAPGSTLIRGYLGAPLLAGDEVVGVLCADSWRRDAFDAEDLRRLCRFATHVGAALARARSHSLALAQSVALQEAALLATHDPNADDIVQRILDGARRVVSCDGASILLREGDRARIAAIHNHPETVLGHCYTIAGRPTLETPLLRGRPFLTLDLSAEPGYEPAPGAVHIRGHLSIPLQARGEIVGMLAIDSVRRGAYGPEDLHRVELFAGYAAAALLNARLHAAVRAAAERDPVTDLFNHRAIHDHLDRALLRARSQRKPLAIAMLDLDGFKLYNDTHGHPAGDAALQAVAATLSAACRQGDRVGRYGGDEFLVVLPGLGPREAAALGARLRDAVAARTLCPAGGPALPLRVSVGVASYPHDGTDRDVLVARADARLYESKQRGVVVAAGSAEAEGLGQTGDAFGVLDGLVTAVDRKDRYTRAHSEEVTRLALLLGAELGLSPETLRAVRLAGLLHDVGKIGVPDRILKKPAPLTPEEREV